MLIAMDFNVKKLASDAGVFFSRAMQVGGVGLERRHGNGAHWGGGEPWGRGSPRARRGSTAGCPSPGLLPPLACSRLPRSSVPPQGTEHPALYSPGSAQGAFLKHKLQA